MLFNAYIWSLYKASDEGAAFIRDCAPATEFDWDEVNLQLLTNKDAAELKRLGLEQYTKENEVGIWANVQRLYHHFFQAEAAQLSTKEDFERRFVEWVEEGISFKGFTLIPAGDYALWMGDIEIISNALYAVFPEWAFPYLYTRSQGLNLQLFRVICDLFQIALPPYPLKKDKKQRLLYYLHICREVHAFRQQNQLLPPELIAFFFDFAFKAADQAIQQKWSITENRDLPRPSKVWYVGAGRTDFHFIDNATIDDLTSWQCNINTRPGDIIIMYCWSPRSCIHSVWQAVTEGNIDVFFYYYNQAYISNCQRVPFISYHDILTNPILSKTPLARNSFQGVNGYPVTYEEYQEMLRLWAEKGFDIESLPKLQPLPGIDDNILLADERDVEQYLVEPLLDKLGFKSKDWLRQMPIRMGRGERYYPDYCFFPNTRRGEESAAMVLEAKWSIHNARELREAFLQARSYAVRLQANRFILAAKEGVWVFESLQGGFKEDQYYFFSWQDLVHPDALHRLLLLAGRAALAKAGRRVKE